MSDAHSGSPQPDALPAPLLRVALVDDNAPFRVALLRTLNSLQQLQVVGEAADGENGLRLIAATHPDIVLLDIVMPGLDGWDVLEELRKRGPTPRVILLSSYMDAGLDRIARQHGADWGVAKGEVADLIAALEAVAATIRGEKASRIEGTASRIEDRGSRVDEPGAGL